MSATVVHSILYVEMLFYLMEKIFIFMQQIPYCKSSTRFRRLSSWAPRVSRWKYFLRKSINGLNESIPSPLWHLLSHLFYSISLSSYPSSQPSPLFRFLTLLLFQFLYFFRSLSLFVSFYRSYDWNSGNIRQNKPATLRSSSWIRWTPSTPSSSI